MKLGFLVGTLKQIGSERETASGQSFSKLSVMVGKRCMMILFLRDFQGCHNRSCGKIIYLLD